MLVNPAAVCYVAHITLFKTQVRANTALQSYLPFQRAIRQATITLATSDD